MTDHLQETEMNPRRGTSFGTANTFTTTVPISAYPFLTVSNLHRLPPEDINFLELKKCLRVPSRVYLDEILQQYFRYVHPFFPLVNEASFWDMYHGVDPGKSPERFSLLVLQAMLFTACSFVSANTLEQLGYSSVRAARRIMYGRAKMLYDFETEKSQLHMAQAALLLSYWTPPFEEAAIKPNTGWLRAAIENARSVRAHQWNFNPAKPGPSSEVQMSLRKLWSLGLDSNTTFSLTFDDFKDEIHESRVYDARTKKQLIVAFLGLAEMCAQVVAMSALLFPFDNSDAGAKRQIGLVEEISKILTSKKTLDRWHGKTVECLSDPFNQSRDHPSIALFTNLQHIYYFSARIAFANRLMLSCYDNEGAVPRDVMHLREEVQESTVSIGKCLATLTELNLDRYLPVSVVPCIALPLALNSNTTPTSPKARIFSEAMKTYSRLYEGVDGLARAIRVIVNQERDSQLAETSEISTTTTLVDRTDAFQSGCYMRLALTIDLSLSRGNLPDEADLPVTIRSSSSPESLGHPATVRPLPDSCTGGSPKSDMDSSVSDGNTPRAQPTTNEWLDPNISLPPLSQTDEEDGLWHLAELSPGKTDYDMLESIIWSGLDDSMFS
ncbi:Cutinase transcription factor 1 beta like protein [Verticillium longisporum]|uniref:Cutinase transcription factor 1 beta like protein n=1 Tax=Verticillium longisporum TaxID=100787 RepID=A0A8I3AJ62_VERLO|nr:Cutinase transcription factor 1 beta like protein [Verticillium longisporum]